MSTGRSNPDQDYATVVGLQTNLQTALEDENQLIVILENYIQLMNITHCQIRGRSAFFV
jgi:hypothetical protein